MWKEVDHDAALDRQYAAVPGGRLAARHEWDALTSGPLHQRHQLCFRSGLHHRVGQRVADQRLDHAGHFADVVTVQLALHPPRRHTLSKSPLEPF
jgi:hypothetical protein